MLPQNSLFSAISIAQHQRYCVFIFLSFCLYCGIFSLIVFDLHYFTAPSVSKVKFLLILVTPNFVACSLSIFIISLFSIFISHYCYSRDSRFALHGALPPHTYSPAAEFRAVAQGNDEIVYVVKHDMLFVKRILPPPFFF